jgi:hypothetical protein
MEAGNRFFDQRIPQEYDDYLISVEDSFIEALRDKIVQV